MLHGKWLAHPLPRHGEKSGYATIVTVDSTKDLGIIITQNLTWENHYKLMSGNAYKILGLIRRSFSGNGPVETRKRLYISLVRSQILYCSQVWRPHLIKNITTIERIQRRATKWILNDYQSSYRSRLVTLHLLPLMYVYEMNDIMFFIKSYKQQSSHFNITEYVQFSTSNTRFGASEKMVHHRCSSNTAQNFYFYRLPRLWNSLPKIDLSLSTNIIKHKLYNYMWDHFMQQFNDTNIHTFHYLCPCCHCSTASPSPIYAVLL